jgi:hypothetical protein
MNRGPKVSAIIATHNRAAYVTRAIDSALAQTWPDVEVVVTDDGSTDNTAEVLAGYGDRIRVVSQPNQGLSAARNAAIKASSGAFLALLDDDDEWLPERLAVQMPCMLDNPKAGLVGGGAVVIDAAGKPLPHRRPVRTGVEHVAFKAFFAANRINCPTALIRRSVMDSVGPFDETLPYAEDYDMWLRIAAGHQVIVVPQPVARYRIWQGNKSGKRNADIALWVECHSAHSRAVPARIPRTQGAAAAPSGGALLPALQVSCPAQAPPGRRSRCSRLRGTVEEAAPAVWRVGVSGRHASRPALVEAARGSGRAAVALRACQLPPVSRSCAARRAHWSRCSSACRAAGTAASPTRVCQTRPAACG